MYSDPLSSSYCHFRKLTQAMVAEFILVLVNLSSVPAC